MSVRLINGDCREVLRTLPDASVQCCVTSPPYFGLRSYLDADDQNKRLEIGSEKTPDEYVATLVGVFREIWRVLRNDGTVWLNLGDSYAMSTRGAGGQGKQHTNADSVMTDRSWRIPSGLKAKDLLGIPWMAAFALRADGWYLRSAITWAKPNPMPESCTDRPTSSYEMVFLLAKRPTYFYDADAIAEQATAYEHTSRYGLNPSHGASAIPGRSDTNKPRSTAGISPPKATRNRRNVWTIASAPFPGQHYATFPPELPETCIKAGTSEAGACLHCGAPWERIVEKGDADREHQIACGGSANDGGYNGTALKDYATAKAQNASDVKRRILEGMRTKRTTGWRPTCSCPEHTPRPCVVLDPFAGSGTTGMVADRLGRDAVLIELKQDGLAQDRITRDCPLFAEVVA